MNIEELLIKAKTNDENAIKELYDLTYKKSYIIAKTMMKNESDVLDVLQNAYVIVFSKLDQLNEPERFEHWVYRIVNTTCLQEYRKRKDIPFSDVKKDDYAIDIEETSDEFIPDKKVNYEHDKNIVRTFIEELPFDQRNALVMKYFEDMKIKEIAEVYGCSENTIKSRINYAKKTLEQKIEEYRKKGNKLFVFPVIPFIRWMFEEETKMVVVPKYTATTLETAKVTSSFGKTVTSGTKVVKNAILKKIIVASVAVSSVTGGVYGINRYVENQNLIEHKEELLPEMERMFNDEYVNGTDEDTIIQSKDKLDELYEDVKYCFGENSDEVKKAKDYLISKEGMMYRCYLFNVDISGKYEDYRFYYQDFNGDNIKDLIVIFRNERYVTHRQTNYDYEWLTLLTIDENRIQTVVSLSEENSCLDKHDSSIYVEDLPAISCTFEYLKKYKNNLLISHYGGYIGRPGASIIKFDKVNDTTIDEYNGWEWISDNWIYHNTGEKYINIPNIEKYELVELNSLKDLK